jgi:hypothetical protein
MFPNFPPPPLKNIEIESGYLTKKFRACLRKSIYLGEFEAEFKKALARESGAQGVLFEEKKTPKAENLVALSLSISYFFLATRWLPYCLQL